MQSMAIEGADVIGKAVLSRITPGLASSAGFPASGIMASVTHAQVLQDFVSILEEACRPLGSYRDSAWLRVLDEEDRNEFEHELADAVDEAYRTGSCEPIEECLNGWRVTAQALSDPLRRSILLRPHRDEDFIEVKRPQ